MAIKKLQHCFTNRKQSKRLLELGVPADSADCFFYLNSNDSDNPHILYKKLSEKQADYDSPFSSIKALLYPCWSVGRLMEIFDICYTEEDADAKWENHNALHKDQTYLDYIMYVFEHNYMCGKLDFSKMSE